jgi:hypothetical protein
MEPPDKPLDRRADSLFINLFYELKGGGELRYLNGLAAGSDGSLYYSEDNAIRRVSAGGEVSTVIASPTLSTCVSIPGDYASNATRPRCRCSRHDLRRG